MIQYTFRIEEDLLKKVQEKAAKEKRSVNQMLNLILEEYFNNEEKK